MRKSLLLLVAVISALPFFQGCATSHSGHPLPGAEKTTKTRALETGAKIVQSRAPVQALDMYLNGFHFHSGDLAEQMTAYHYCSVLNEEVKQCAIYDGDGKEARLIGVEYIVSERLFSTLPEAERRLWHSHRYEVKSGTLAAPGIPLPVEHQLMEQILSTYGKTWHTWDSHRDQLPLGIPSLMMGFTADGQLDQRLVRERDQKDKVDTGKRREDRASIADPTPVPGADAWEAGLAPVLSVTDKPLKKR